MSYTICYLWNLVSEAMAVDIEGIASSLGSSIEHFTRPFDATKRAQMTMRAQHNVIQENGVELGSGPLVLHLVRNLQIIGKICANPFGQFRGQPSQDWMGCTILVGHPF